MSQQQPQSQREIWRRGIADALACAAGSIIPTLLASIGALIARRPTPALAYSGVKNGHTLGDRECAPDVDQLGDVDQVDLVDVGPPAEDVDQVAGP